MILKEKFLTENACFKQNKKMIPKGITVHSTATPGVMNETWFSAWNNGSINKAVHAFIDKDGIMQTLPWDTVGWHSGTGFLGKEKNANNSGYIGFEICEPSGHSYSGGTMINYDSEKNTEYFNSVYKQAVELCAYLCEKFSISADNIICHSEGYALGIASNHSDVMQWFPKHGKNMDIFRNDVKEKLGGQKMRSFKLSEEMNFRQTPNGKKIGTIPTGTVISGSMLSENNGIYWLYTRYNNADGYVAVLPESKKYAVEIPATTEKYEDAVRKLEAIRKILNE